MGVDITLFVSGDVDDKEFMSANNEFGFRIYDAHLVRDENNTVTLNNEVLWTSYWGPGYERGPWPQIAGWIEALRAAFPSRTVHYGGDTYDEEDTPAVDDQRMQDYWAHWRSPEAHNYRKSFL